ncbi:MAG: 50S ribosomal protein L6 [Firmicutes bacterium]|nr:50S ribosomal protein L6 [Bacillota bacterium]
MSRIGRTPITIPAGVKVEFKDGIVTVEGPKGKLSQSIVDKKIDVKIGAGTVDVVRLSEAKPTKAKHGLYRQLINNMVNGVVTPYSKTLIVNGVGWKCNLAGNKLTMNVGLSHSVELTAPEGVSIACPDATTIIVSGISKELVGQVAATIKSKRPVEPYHLYGIRYSTEKLIKKEGKTGGK